VKRVLFVSIVLVLAVSAAAVIAKPKPSNGGFEAGFKGWTRDDTPEDSGRFRTYEKGDKPATGEPLPRGDGEFKKYFDPPRGKKAAVSQQSGPGAHLLLRKLKLKADSKIKLSLYAFYQNYGDRFATPNTLDADTTGMPRGGKGGNPNQQFRIDLIKEDADRYSVKNADVLMKLFRTDRGDRRMRGPFKIKVDLSDLAGQTVILRMAEVDNLGYFAAGVDAIKLKTKPAD
jgi:hypothetical protein